MDDNADNYNVSYTIQCDPNCCEYTEFVEEIYENPAIYIRGDRQPNWLGFLLPDTTSSEDLICAGTYGNDTAADDECSANDVIGADCSLQPLLVCEDFPTAFPFP